MIDSIQHQPLCADTRSTPWSPPGLYLHTQRPTNLFNLLYLNHNNVMKGSCCLRPTRIVSMVTALALATFVPRLGQSLAPCAASAAFAVARRASTHTHTHPPTRQSRGTTSTRTAQGRLVSVHGTAHRHDYYDRHEDALFLAENAVHVLARNGRSWRRLKHLVDLALRSSGSNNTDTDTDTDTDTASSSSSNNNNLVQKSVADIGTDHGLLAAALALSGRFKSVLGVDASDKALQEGALALHAEIIEYRSRQQQPEQSQTTSMSSVPLSTPPLSQLEFRHGDGLQVVRPGEADIVCIAGMGVHTMLHILSGTKSSTERETLATLDYLACQQLILQPTNSRPRNLMMLYTGLRDRGWHVNDERIEYLSSRWYFSTSFVRSSQETHNGNDAGPLPGFKLLDQDKDSDIFRNYVEHHCSWLREDKQAAGNLRGGEEEWLEAFDNTTGTTTY